MTAVLKITDGTTAINLIGNGIQLLSWRPQIATWKNGGTYVDSQLADGRQLVDVKTADATDTYNLTISGSTQDEAIGRMQDLLRILEQAVNYWVTDYESRFVWIERRATCESYPVYAIVKNYRLVEDENPFAQPFTGDPAVKNNLQLILEHGPWLDNPPGVETCVETGNEVTISTSTTNYGSNMNFESFAGAAPVVFTSWTNVIGVSCSVENAAAPHGGTGAPELRVSGTPAPRSVAIHQNIAISPGTYNFSFWIKTTNGVASQRFDVAIGTSYGANDILLEKYDSILFNDWTQKNYTFTVPESVFMINVSFLSNKLIAGADSYTAIDDASISIQSTYTKGTPDNCTGTYVTNGRYPYPINNIFVYDASAANYSANILAGGFPAALFPNPAGVGDILYIGATGGPFASVLFDVLTANTALTLVWEYWNGAAWVGALNTDDRTSNFTITGLNSVGFQPPSAWATVAVNGVTAYWTRVRVTVVGAGNVPTVNDGPFAIQDPWIEIDETRLDGDIQAILQQKLYNLTGVPSVPYYTNRIIAGSRFVDRGTSFISHINLTNAGVPAVGNESSINISIDVTRITGGVTDAQAPAGTRMLFTSAIESLTSRVVVVPVTANDYQGSFRVFLRCQQTNGSINQVFTQLRMTIGSDTIYTSNPVYVGALNTYTLLDFGKITVAPRNLAPGEAFGDLRFNLYFGSTANGTLVRLYDLILIPVDEWAGDFSNAGGATNTYYAKLDSIEQPKVTLRAGLFSVASNAYWGTYQVIANGAFQVEPRRKMRFYYLTENFPTASTRNSYPAMSHETLTFGQDRYLGMRGDEA